ncbi:hypothetical protein [Nesterenkonia xinjiangensis]|uniref:Uncharacterized protein n=1 Tax=Nesterenkonia xinjiangensis TaxID=225327 RepID=A0A7Z0KAN9_9MICC|nr:hypothetical protein [Nesterenkonia xinjiangensis]NYJ78485.1 hypothetical protein [Nesterenkonia xinjiangensis]
MVRYVPATDELDEPELDPEFDDPEFDPEFDPVSPAGTEGWVGVMCG